MDEILQVMREAALAGNDAIRETRMGMMLRHKGYKEIVTNCDIASENAITGILKRELPAAAIYSEEVGDISGDEELLFIIDPIDGTHNFIHDIPFFAVSIGTFRKGSAYAGLIYMPDFDTCYSAVRGAGAIANSRKIKASDVSSLSDAMIAYDNQFQKHDAMLKNLPLLADKCFTLRIFGSACVDLCNVACGRIDARIFHKTKIEDFAAGITLVEEAGGMVTDFSGKPVTVGTTDVIASNGKIHEELIRLLEL